MPRKTIYIRNPAYGSHFRTIIGKGSGGVSRLPGN